MKADTNNRDTVHYQGINISYEFPKLAKDNPPESVILTAMDFFRGEIVELEVSNLVDISDLSAIDNTTGYLSPEEQIEYERILDEQYKDTGININELI